MGKPLSILAIILVIIFIVVASMPATNIHVCTASKLEQNRTVGQAGLSYKNPEMYI